MSQKKIYVLSHTIFFFSFTGTWSSKKVIVSGSLIFLNSYITRKKNNNIKRLKSGKKKCSIPTYHSPVQGIVDKINFDTYIFKKITKKKGERQYFRLHTFFYAPVPLSIILNRKVYRMIFTCTTKNVCVWDRYKSYWKLWCHSIYIVFIRFLFQYIFFFFTSLMWWCQRVFNRTTRWGTQMWLPSFRR